MCHVRLLLVLTPGLVCAVLAGVAPAPGQGPPTGPETEKRFPPLVVPAGFRATLFACDPLVEYPSAVALGPRPGSILVAADYLTGLGTEIIRRDEVRLVEDTDGDGYADRATVYASGFHSIQGLTYHQGTLYVMHAPLLTALRDTNGDGTADERRDLVNGLGLPPEQNPVRLHCANGLVMGHDGWLYLALGDHGCKVGPLVLEGGGILRCRADGSGLHVFATGLRNIYDVVLDEELNVFVRDNENDGGDYKIRVCHSFFGADHGYPYLYYERPDEALPPLADLGLGSSAGGVCYLETRFPPEYHGNLFFCEWGRAVMRCRPVRSGSGFAPLREEEFAAGADKDPYGFKPTDVIVDRDGALLVVDWADGQRPRRGRGRVYRIAPAEPAPLPQPGGRDDRLVPLDAPSYYQRCEAQAALEREGAPAVPALHQALRGRRLGVRGRMHAVWALAHLQLPVRDLLDIARTDPEPRVQVQALRALMDRVDPALGGTRAEAAALAPELAALAPGRDPRVVLEVVIALGRLGWAATPAWLRQHLVHPDAALAHAAMQTLRRAGNWSGVLELLNLPDTEPVRAIALRAVADRAEASLVDGLIARLRSEPQPSRRLAYADLLTRVARKPGPWTYWGYRPPPRPPHTVPWERTEAIAQALDRVLADDERSVRVAVLRRMQRENIPAAPATLGRWLADERQPEHVSAILAALRGQPAEQVRELLTAAVREQGHTPANRLVALRLLAEGLDTAGRERLRELGDVLEPGPVLAELLRHLGRPPVPSARPLLVRHLGAPVPGVRAAALEVLADLGADEARAAVPRLLDDGDAEVRQAAADAAGKLGVRPAAAALLRRADDTEPAVRRACLRALSQLRDARVVAVAARALADPPTALPALECLAALGGPEHAAAVAALARRDASSEVLAGVVRTLTAWAATPKLAPETRRALEQSVAEVQGASGILLRWEVVGPLPRQEALQAGPALAATPPGAFAARETARPRRTHFAAGTEARLSLGKAPAADSVWLAFSDVVVPEAAPVQLLGSGTGPFRVWLNGQRVYQREQPGTFQLDSERFPVTLAQGLNRLLVEVAPQGQAAAEMHLRVRRHSSAAEHERLIEAALTRRGDPERGRKLFADVEKSQCLRCHRLGDQGERIGPELTGIGSRFPRVYLIESILEPSRTVAPSYETYVVALKDGRVFTGVKVQESATTLTLADTQGQRHELARSAVDEQHRQPQSTMPEGLARKLTTAEFVDLIAFLVSQKEPRGR